MNLIFFRQLLTLAIASLLATTPLGTNQAAADEDWPTFAHDGHRNAATDATLTLPLAGTWVHRADQAPSPAWPPPAQFDYWHYKQDLHPRVTFDHAFQVAAVGDRIYYGSSTDDSVVCLDAHTGMSLWTFYTEAPVRLAPTVAHEKLYVGSDDGLVYCLSTDGGELLWKQQVGPQTSRCIGNGRMISRWPVRSGILLHEDIAYAAAGLFPTTEGVYLAGLDAETGAPVMRRKIEQSVQGYMALTQDQLILPSGRTSPQAYRRADGQPIGKIASAGGTYTVVSSDLLVTGQGDTEGELSLVRRDSREHLLSLRGLHLITFGNYLYVHSRNELAALNRDKFLPLAYRHAALKQQLEQAKKQKGSRAKGETARLEGELDTLGAAMQSCWLWKSPCDHAESLILAGDKLFAGGNQSVIAVDIHSGKQVWSSQVDGRACGLAAARGRLLVSTDKGAIHCFSDAASTGPAPHTSATFTDKQTDKQTLSQPAPESPSRLAKEIASRMAGDQGFCLIKGNEGGPLAAEIAQATRLRVIVLQRDPQTIARTRALLQKRGLLGTRVVVHQESSQPLPYPPYFANLIVSFDADPSDGVRFSDETARLLRPEGGVAWLQSADNRVPLNPETFPENSFSIETAQLQQRSWSIVRRQTLPGSGQWTHGFANAGNSASTEDQLVQGPVRIQWFGRPGPHLMADRHHRNVAPLYTAGRLFVPGANVVIAVDAYNGTELWKRDIPKSLRLGAFLDCSNMVVDNESLYVVAEDSCHVLNVTNGNAQPTIALPQLVADQPHHWGYVARVDELLIGSGRKPEASYNRQSRNDDLALWYDNMSLVTSDYLFAIPSKGNVTAWTYQSGIIINSTIAIGGQRVYFLESHAPAALQNQQGRMPMSTFQDGACFLVALDLQSGKTLWKRPFDLSNCQHIVYLNYAQEKLVVSGNRYVQRSLWYFFQGIDAKSGADVWQAKHSSGYDRGGDHGEQNRHPTIVGDTVYTYPLAYHLHTGEQRQGWTFDRIGHGCGNLSASAGCIFWRGGNPWQWDLRTASKPIRINSVNRPGCFINIIPAGGMLLIPEASSGCTCGFPLQTSLGYVPAELVE